MEVEKLVLGVVGTNTYFAINEQTKECVIVDPATESKRIQWVVDEYGLIPRAILLTHGHFDHVGGVEKYRNMYGIPVYEHRDDFAISVGDGETFGFNVMKDLPEHAVEDGEVIRQAGLEIRVMHTPGHSPGSVCYICEDAIFSGDTLFCMSIGRTDLSGGDFGQIMRSLERLAALEGDYRLYPGHESSSSLSFERANNPYMNGQLRA